MVAAQELDGAVGQAVGREGVAFQRPRGLGTVSVGMGAEVVDAVLEAEGLRAVAGPKASQRKRRVERRKLGTRSPSARAAGVCPGGRLDPGA